MFAPRTKMSVSSLKLRKWQFVKSYKNFGKFEKDYHGVDLGNGFVTDKAGAEIMKYISINKSKN